MTKICLFSMMMLICITACKKEQTKISDNLSRKAESPLLADTVIFGTDWSGTVSTAIVKKELTSTNLETYISVPDGYVVIGGGVESLPESELPGVLVTASNPMPDFLTWHVALKDPAGPISHRFVAYSVGLKLAGFSRQDLVTDMGIFSDSSAISAHPATFASVYSVDYTMIGGGARVNDISGNGNYLVQSIPVGNTWYVSSKDQNVSSPATINAYAVGLKTKILNTGNWEIVQESKGNSVQSGFGIASLGMDQTWVAGCPGAEATYAGNGRLLRTIKPAVRDVLVISQDYKVPDSGNTTAYTLKIRRKM